MRFAFNDDQLALFEAVRQVLDRECTPADLRAAAVSGASERRWEVLAELGALGLLVGEDQGGLGMSEVELVGVLEEAGRASLPEPLAETAALAVPLLTDPARLEALAAGELVVGTGGIDLDARGPWPASEPSGGGSVRTHRVVGASSAGLLLLWHGEPGGPWELHAVPVEAAAVERTPSVDPTRDLSSVTWRPGPGTRLLEGAEAESAMRATLDRAALATAAQLLGLADRMLTMTAEYAKARVQFGKPIGSFQAVKHHLANARVRLDFARPATYRAAYAVAHHEPGRLEHCAMAKALASDAADLGARVALQVHGAIGYTWECDLQLYMKRAWALSAAWGNAATHRARVLEAALASPAHSID